MAQCAANDRRAQEKLYRHFFPIMLSMCRKHTSDQETAYTIINDGMLKVFKNITSYNFEGSFEGWVRRIVYRSLSDYYRKENKYLKFLVFEEKEKNTHQNALSGLYYEDLISMTKSLPDKMSKVFHMYAIEGFNHREIGEQLSMSDGTSKWYLSEARKELKKRLSAQDVKTAKK